jgi:hypothetical protein
MATEAAKIASARVAAELEYRELRCLSLLR